jgi:uncharacterized protein (TIGR03118 family)
MMRRLPSPVTASPAKRGRLRRAALAMAGASAALVMLPGTSGSAAVKATPYTQTNLISDIPGVARITDPNLVNPWGVAEFPGGPLWVADNNANVATVYTGDVGGTPLTSPGLVVKIPGGAPTGQVFNGTSGFVVHHGLQKGPAKFIFSSENGDITGWNPAVGGTGTATSTTAELAVSVPHAVYKGLAIVGHRLYATNFHSGHVDVFNSRFHRVRKEGAFTDRALPDGYAPFGIASIGDKLYVSYAKQNAQRHDDLAGPGRGFVDLYSRGGKLLKRLIHRGMLNSPWGMVIAPAMFGSFSNDLLVGNFGDGAINAYDPSTGAFRGALKNTDGNPIVIQGLWGLILGNGVAGTPQTLFFTAGIADEAHGLLGAINLAS